MKPALNGAWEEPGVIGIRIEIKGHKLTVLWRSDPVLQTTFRTKTSNGATELFLQKTGLRYANSASDYAQVTGLKYLDGKLELTEDFPITGESKTILSQTGNSRYGNYTLANGILKELAGNWISTDGLWTLQIKGKTLLFQDRKTKIYVLQPKSDPASYLIADEDPSRHEFNGFTRFRYQNGTLVTQMLVCDAPRYDIVFEKQTPEK